MSEIAERVAAAISTALDVFGPERGVEYYAVQKAARAAIEAMREPSEAMIDAAGNADRVGDDGRDEPGSPESIYRAMIDAALTEDAT